MRYWQQQVITLVQIGQDAGSQISKQSMAADQYTESIPLLETRDYVKHVMTNAKHYGVVLRAGCAILAESMNIIPVRNEPLEHEMFNLKQ